MEFDLQTLAPTYRLTIGLPGRSNAFAIAKRLGLDGTIIDESRTMVTATDLEAEKLLDEIHRQHDLARKERALAEAVRADAIQLESELARRLERIDEERGAVLDQARTDAQAEIDSLQTEIRELRRKLQAAAVPLSALKEIESAADGLADDLESSVPSLKSSVQSVKSVDENAHSASATPSGCQPQDRRHRPLTRPKPKCTGCLARPRQTRRTANQSQTPTSTLPLPLPHAHTHTPTPPHTHHPAWKSTSAAKPSKTACLPLDRYLDAAYNANLPGANHSRQRHGNCAKPSATRSQ